MASASKKSEPLLYPPLTAELKARLRKAGHGHLVDAVEDISEDTIKGLIKGMKNGPVFRPKAAKKAA